jgi:hypothetical protein
VNTYVIQMLLCSCQIPFDFLMPDNVRIIFVCLRILGARDWRDFVSFDCGMRVPCRTSVFGFFPAMAFVSINFVLNGFQSLFLFAQ